MIRVAPLSISLLNLRATCDITRVEEPLLCSGISLSCPLRMLLELCDSGITGETCAECKEVLVRQTYAGNALLDQLAFKIVFCRIDPYHHLKRLVERDQAY